LILLSGLVLDRYFVLVFVLLMIGSC